MDIVLPQIFTGLSIASILLLVALGLGIIYGTMGVINLAHGDFVMLGAYASWFLQSHLGMGLLSSVVASFFVVAAVGWALERGIVRHLYARPLDTILATWGIGIMLEQGIRLSAGSSLKYVKLPNSLAANFQVFGVTVGVYRLLIIAVALALLGFTLYLIRRTELGKRLRAVTQNKEISECYGINASQVYAWTFAYGAGLAGLAGALVAPLKSVSPSMGTPYVVDAFLVVVVGGVGSLYGLLVGSGILGELDSWISFVLNSTLARAIVFLAVVAMIRFRPEGLFTDRVRR